MQMRMLRDWSYHKQGDVVEVWEPTAQNWMLNGIAEPAPAVAVPEPAPEPVVEAAEAIEPEDVERADRRPKRK
jgi:hypothetical protein